MACLISWCGLVPTYVDLDWEGIPSRTQMLFKENK